MGQHDILLWLFEKQYIEKNEGPFNVTEIAKGIHANFRSVAKQCKSLWLGGRGYISRPKILDDVMTGQARYALRPEYFEIVERLYVQERLVNKDNDIRQRRLFRGLNCGGK